MDEEAKLRSLQGALGHEFGDGSLLNDALTHSSYKNERPNVAPRDNERLEFLGDAVVGFVASAVLSEALPDASEGELTRRRADLVCEASLAELAQEMSVGDCLRLGKGEESSGGRENARLLASALEALVAAVYLDGGMDPAMSFVASLFTPRLSKTAPGANDYKSKLQEKLQAQGRRTPVYRQVRSEGPDHDRTFFVEVEIEGEVYGAGSGKSKSEAQRIAARVACKRLEERS